MTANAYLKLNDGIYNGQIKKICLHPSYNLTTSSNYSYEVLIDIDSFYDPDGNQQSSAVTLADSGLFITFCCISCSATIVTNILKTEFWINIFLE